MKCLVHFSFLVANIVGGVYKVLATMKDSTERIIAINELLKIYLDQMLANVNAIKAADLGNSTT